MPIETRPLVSSLSLVDVRQSQIGLLTADSQMSSSILIQEARRRHQPRLDFPRRNPKAEISCPKPSKAMELGVSLWSFCQYVIIVSAASWQHCNPLQMCQQNSLFIIIFLYYYFFFSLNIHCREQASSLYSQEGS